jgi:methionine synthase II (cobalamin-independent)
VRSHHRRDGAQHGGDRLMTHPWPVGASTGVGSLPFTDPVEALKLVLGENAELPYLPELPNRGVGSDAIGRTASLLVDFPVEWLSGGWTVTAAPGRDAARARDHLSWDLDALIENAQGLPLLKVQVVGPMTLAASVELLTLHKVLTDSGALRELTQSLVEGVAQHLAFLRAQLPGTDFVLQVDEPSLPAVLAGRIKTPSGVGTVRAIERAVAEPALATLLDTVPDGFRAVHCCAPDAPLELFRGAGANAVSIDASLLTDSHLDQLGETLDAGVSVWLGLVPGTDASLRREQISEQVRTMWNRLGFPLRDLPSSVVPTPSCGMAGASGAYVRAAMKTLRDVGRELNDLSE